MGKFKVGDEVQMYGIPVPIKVKDIGVCDLPYCTEETVGFDDPESGERDWVHASEFELRVTP